MKRSVVIVVLGLFLIVPLAYFLFVYSSGIADPDVKGTSSVENNLPENGFSLEVSSKAGTWDMYEYACKTKEACLTSLMSGVRFGTVGGGQGELSSINVLPDSSWEENEYIKVFVKSGWGSPERSFAVVNMGDIEGTEVANVEYEGVNYTVLLIPVDSLDGGFMSSGRFSDN